MRRRWIERVIAAVLLLAAGLKARQLLDGSSTTIYGVIHSAILVALLIQSEFLLAIWLLIGGFARARFVVAVACFSLFAIVSGYEAMHAVASCGCFGNVKVPPAATAVFDVCAVFALCVTRRMPPPRPSPGVPGEGGRWERAEDEYWPSRRRLIAGISFATIVSAGMWTIYFTKPANALAAGVGLSDLVVLNPTEWLNQPFPLLSEIDNSQPLQSGKWLLLLYHFDCDDCLKAIPDYQTLAAGQKNYRVAFIAMPPFAPGGREPVAQTADYLNLRLRPDHDWFATTPVVVQLQDGRVLAVVQGADALQPPNWR